MKNIARFGWTDDDMTIEERSPGAKELIILFRAKGSAKSGNYNHAGRPGLVGGSAPRSYKTFAPGDKAGIHDFLHSVYPEGDKDCDANDDPCRSYSRYTGSYYKVINSLLRGKPPRTSAAFTSKYGEQQVKADVERIDNLMAQHAVPEDVIVHRGSRSRTLVSQWDDLKPGDEFTDKGYVSASLLPRMSEMFAGRADEAHPQAEPHSVLMTIRVPAGTHALASNFREEQELTLPRDSKFRILDMRKTPKPNGNFTYDMELELVQ